MDYQKQANDIASEMGLTLETRYIGHMKYFDDDKQERAVFEITLEKNNESYTFKFGKSIEESYRIRKGSSRKNLNMFDVPFSTKKAFKQALKKTVQMYPYNVSIQKKDPTMYDVLTYLQKYEVGDITEFCQEFGYDTDSIKTNALYKRVADDYRNVCRLFNAEELEILQEVQ